MTHKEEIEQLLAKGELTNAIEELLRGTKAQWANQVAQRFDPPIGT